MVRCGVLLVFFLTYKICLSDCVKLGEKNLRSKTIKLNVQPRHVHLSIKYGDQMTITWSSKDRPDLSFVEYGIQNSSLPFPNVQAAITDQLTSTNGKVSNVQFIHEATLKDLIPDQIYYYRCVSRQNGSDFSSKVFELRLPPVGPQWPRPGGPSLLIFGDLGYENAISLPFLEEEVDTGKYEAIIHVGDLAYDLNTDGGKVGDEFLNIIEKMAARLPYQVCPGNHEVDHLIDYNDYKKRFRMGGKFDSLMYSWNLGQVHFVAINTENYFYTKDHIQEQFDWLETDLQEANKFRDIRPWIIVYGHSPMYCSHPLSWSHECVNVDNPVRVGIAARALAPGLEDLMYKNGVDLLLWGHEHDYEASYPVFNYTILNGNDLEPYRNPRGPIHIITGAAGSKFPRDGWDETLPYPAWSRIRTVASGYSRLRIENKTHLHFEQVDVTQAENGKMGKVIDSFTLIQEQHGPFPPLSMN